MRSAMMVLLPVLAGCVGGVRLAGDADEAPDAHEAATEDVPPPPPTVSPRWCPAVAADRPCRPVERARFAAEGRIAALGFLDDGVVALVARRQGGAHSGSIDLLRLGVDGGLEQRGLRSLDTELTAAWTGDGFAATMPGRIGEAATWLRILPDGTVAWSASGNWFCEDLAWTGTDFRCLTATTRDLSWWTVADDGRVSNAHEYDVDNFLRTTTWSERGPALLYGPSGETFLQLDGAGAVVGGPTTIIRGNFADVLLAAGRSDFVVLGLIGRWDLGSAGLHEPWRWVDVVVGRVDSAGRMRHRPVFVARAATDTHEPSWGPTHFGAAAGDDDAVVVWRTVVPHADDEPLPDVAHPMFRVVTADGLLGDPVELSPTDDDDWLEERFFLQRAGTGLVVARSHSGSAGLVPALEVWLGCCE
jgi:hypothetical protein